MSDNEDLLGDDLGDHSLADYNLGNDEEDQLLADDFDGGSSHNVPSSLESFREPTDMVPSDYTAHGMEYIPQPIPYQPVLETECVVPNIVVEVPNIPAHSTYAPYEPRHYEPEHSVPPAMPAAIIESPQIVPSEIVASIPNDMARERFISERPVGAQRMPQVRDIPDSLDKVVIAGGFAGGRGRTSWRSPQFNARFPHPYRRNNVQRGNFPQRNSFPPPQHVRPLPTPPRMPDFGMEHPPLQPPPMSLIRMDIPNDMPRPSFQPDRPINMQRPPIDMQRSPMDMQRSPMDMQRSPMDMQRSPMDMQRPPMDMQRPPMDRQRPPFQRFQQFPFREERPMFSPMMSQYERPMYFPRQQFQRFGPPMPQVTIRQNLPDKKEPEIRMLPVPLPASLSGGLAGKKVLINPHFKGNFQPPVEGLSMPAYIPTRIHKSPPISPTLENKFGPIKDIDDAAERFIAEQRNALARAAGRKFARRSPQRYIEDTTIEIENELARRPARRRSDDDDLLRRQEEFIHANRAGLRRRMRSPSPPAGAAPARRSPSPAPPAPGAPPPGAAPRRDSERDRRHRPNDEDSEYKRRVREQESMRERVLRAKEVRRRKNAALYIKQMQDREREEKEKELPHKDISKDTPAKPLDKLTDRVTVKTQLEKPKEEDTKPDTTKKTPERDWTPELDSSKEKSPVKKDDEVNSTCEELTPPPPEAPRAPTPPLDSDDEVDLILGDIDGILSDDDDIIPKTVTKPVNKPEPPKPKPVSDLRSKLLPKSADTKKPQRQKIIFTEEREEKKKKEKSPTRRAVVSSTKADDSELAQTKSAKAKKKQESSTNKSRQRIIFENKDLAKPEKVKTEKPAAFSNRRVIIQRKPTKESQSVFSRIEITNDPSKPNPGIFSRAVRTIGERDRTERETNRIVIKNEPEIEYDSSSDDEDRLLNEEIGNVAKVDNLPHGMTDTRLKTLAGDIQSLILDKEERTAKITFKSTNAAETFKKKFNNKMVAASRLTVTLQ